MNKNLLSTGHGHYLLFNVQRLLSAHLIPLSTDQYPPPVSAIHCPLSPIQYAAADCSSVAGRLRVTVAVRRRSGRPAGIRILPGSLTGPRLNGR